VKKRIIEIIDENDIKSVKHFNNFRYRYSKGQRTFWVFIYLKIFLKNILFKWKKI
tara:strand:- start:36986 stop:37150 length:165 start_codon:yes stop_codon:yes gene_type:complete